LLSTTKINRRSRNIFEFLKVQKKLFNKFVTFIILKLSFSNNIISNQLIAINFVAIAIFDNE